MKTFNEILLYINVTFKPLKRGIFLFEKLALFRVELFKFSVHEVIIESSSLIIITNQIKTLKILIS